MYHSFYLLLYVLTACFQIICTVCYRHHRLYPFHDMYERMYHHTAKPLNEFHSPQLLSMNVDEPVFIQLKQTQQPTTHVNFEALIDPGHRYTLIDSPIDVLKVNFARVYRKLYNITQDTLQDLVSGNDDYDWSWVAWAYRSYSPQYTKQYDEVPQFVHESHRLHNATRLINGTRSSFVEALASTRAETKEYAFLDGGEYGHSTCRTCVFVLERLKMGSHIMLAEICQEVYFRFPDQYEECIETIKAMALMGNEVRYWLWMGCYKYEMYLTREWVKPCPSHVICAALRNMFNQPYCRPLPVELPFVDDEFPVLEKGGAPRQEYNVGYDEENIYSLRHDTDSNDQREATVKEKRESRDGGFDEQVTEPPPQRELKLGRGPFPTNAIPLGAPPKVWQRGRDQTWAWQTGKPDLYSVKPPKGKPDPYPGDTSYLD